LVSTVIAVLRYLPIASGAIYVRKYFDENSKAAAVEMTDAIKSEFESMLNSVSWMDDKTRFAALSKIKKMEKHIGHPNELMDDKKLIEYYKDVKIDEKELLLSVLNVNIFGLKWKTKRFREVVNKTDWLEHSDAAMVNAFYDFLENSTSKLELFVEDFLLQINLIFSASSWNLARRFFQCRTTSLHELRVDGICYWT
jgi:predicted metalloendopeptidase